MTAPGESGTGNLSWVRDRVRALVDNIEHVVHGNTEVVRAAVTCLLAEGHLLIEGVPGVAKTTLAKAIAHSIGGRVHRIQFTPDLLPTDVVGVNIYDAANQRFEFHSGPVFANIVLADEINRASPKTQSALLEAMGERQVSVDGRTYDLPAPHFVIATQNPYDHQGTYTLPEAQLDRFMMQLRLGYPAPEHEMRVIGDAIDRRLPEQLSAVTDTEELLRLIEVARTVHVAEPIRAYVVAVVGGTRNQPDTVRLGGSPRAGNALAMAAQARAATEGREYVLPDDVKAMAVPVLRHRLVLTPEAAIRGATAASVLDGILAAVPVPQTATAR
ncbi:ATPase AAA [Actinoplanes sp. SE50]|uniref:AAA family ATPase n=1 Tax=unclassified Actinoplanes TaxID=2626549 RepID=UPI00023EC913|nr:MULTISPECIES: MoxR family ATPase [unclassified Actinoplanes]AEV83125.1 MoxR-like ATPase [Actinoplanes sp. SE50/110]ATO81520.1 ATPase AAA [Actinoplanes sp. SE50]SLL98927.1 ATPase AAA [Actinoplanes sp. SE50/110]